MPRKEILTPFQQKVLNVFSTIEESRLFYLTGGTALSAFYLGHRLSEDLDIFTSDEPLISIVAGKLKTALSATGIQVEEIRKFGSFWEGVVSDGRESIKVQLAYDTPFMISEIVEKEGIRIQSLQDIATGKLLALYGRAEERDFIDIYQLVKEERLTLEEMIALAKQKDPGLDEYYLAIAFEQCEKLPDDSAKLMVGLLTPVDPTKVKMFFRSKAVELLERKKQGL